MKLLVFVLCLACAVPLVAAQTKLGEEPPDPAKARAQAVERAKAYLAGKLKIDQKDVELESAKETSWPDASLGCPEKDRMYAQVVTRGWTVKLKAGGCSHEVRVAGKRAIVCPAKEDSSDGRGR